MIPSSQSLGVGPDGVLAFIEAAHHASRCNARIKHYFDRKARQTKKVVAFKACAHKLARAAYWVMKKQEVFNEGKAYG